MRWWFSTKGRGTPVPGETRKPPVFFRSNSPTENRKPSAARLLNAGYLAAG
jgi:hypothetical protein